MIRSLAASKRTLVVVCLSLLVLCLGARPFRAELRRSKISADSKIDSGDTAWMLTSAALVLMMTGPGLALFYSGLVRRKNVLGTMMQSFILMAVVSVLWAIIGYSLAFDIGCPFIGGLRFAFLRNVGPNPCEYAGTIPHTTWMAYQMMFAVITPALICGAYAERMKFSSMLIFSSLWLLCVYCPLAHMVWGKGGLFNVGVGDSTPGRFAALDFAGGTVVHVSSGVSALICALVIGKRRGYGKVPMPPHSVVLSVIGAALLWIGWFGFNGGSALAANGLASSAFIATHFAAAAATLGWMFRRVAQDGQTHRAGRNLRRGGGPGRHYPSQRIHHADVCDHHGLHRRGNLLLQRHHPQTHVRVRRCPRRFRRSRRRRNRRGPAVRRLRGRRHQHRYQQRQGIGGLVEGNPRQLLSQFLAVLLTYAIAAIGSFILIHLTRITDRRGLRLSESDEYDGLDLTQHGESGYNFEESFPATMMEDAGPTLLHHR